MDWLESGEGQDMDVSQLHEGEYTSALDQLRNWASWQRSLSVLAATP